MNQLDTLAMSEALKEVIKHCGVDVLSDNRRFQSVIKDVMTKKSLKTERRLLMFSVEIGIGKELLKVIDKEKEDKERALVIIDKKLTDYGFNQNYRTKILSAFKVALGWDEVKSPNEDNQSNVKTDKQQIPPSNQVNNNQASHSPRLIMFNQKKASKRLARKPIRQRSHYKGQSNVSKKGIITKGFTLLRKTIGIVMFVIVFFLFITDLQDNSVYGSWQSESDPNSQATIYSSDKAEFTYIENSSDLFIGYSVAIYLRRNSEENNLYTVSTEGGSVSLVVNKEPYFQQLVDWYDLDMTITSDMSYVDIKQAIIDRAINSNNINSSNFEIISNHLDSIQEKDGYLMIGVPMDEIENPEMMDDYLKDHFNLEPFCANIVEEIRNYRLEAINNNTIVFGGERFKRVE